MSVCKSCSRKKLSASNRRQRGLPVTHNRKSKKGKTTRPPKKVSKIIVIIIIVMRYLNAPSLLSRRHEQQTIKQKDAKFQTPKTHTQYTQMSQ